MTCNLSWPEIKNELLLGQSLSDCLDFLTRLFHAKFEELKTNIINSEVLGKVIANVHFIEFQK